MKSLSILATAFILIALIASPAAAEVRIEYHTQNQVVEGDEDLTFSITASAALTNAELVFERSDGNRRVERIGSTSAGQEHTFILEQPRGTFTYDVTFGGVYAGEEVNFRFQFDAVVHEPLQVRVDLDRVDIDQGRLPLHVNRGIDRIEYEVIDADQNVTFSRTQAFENRRGDLLLEWDPRGTVRQVRLTVHTAEGQWSNHVLTFYSVEIPHQTVNFRFGAATWDDSEEPKLVETRRRIRQEMEENAEGILQMQLYIAGYTDTVGSAESNQRLSTERARAIATWFRQNGIDIPIYYQGFGQEVLAVQTPDQTEEARNRRALYILATTPPRRSAQIPRSNWQALD